LLLPLVKKFTGEKERRSGGAEERRSGGRLTRDFQRARRLMMNDTTSARRNPSRRSGLLFGGRRATEHPQPEVEAADEAPASTTGASAGASAVASTRLASGIPMPSCIFRVGHIDSHIAFVGVPGGHSSTPTRFCWKSRSPVHWVASGLWPTH